MATPGNDRRLAAILAADVVGYSRLMNRDEAGTLASLKAHRQELIDPKINEYHGRIVKLMGDGMLVEFASVVDAVHCAVDIQLGIAERNRAHPDDSRIELRVGINLGDVILDGDDIYGDGVNIAARLEGLAETGGICVSDVVRQIIKAATDVQFEDFGEKQVKNIAQPIRIWRWASPREAKADEASPISRSQLSEGHDRPSIAVLPFDNLSGDPEQGYFSDGITEDLITDLSQLSGLFVIARNSVFEYRGRSTKPEEIAGELGVRYVLEGSVRRAADRLRINAQLIDATSGHHLWAQRFDGKVDDIFTLQDDITRQIVDALKVRLTLREADSLTYRDTDNVEAFDLFLQAKDFQLQRTKIGLSNARQAFEQALHLDPEFANATALLADNYRLEWTFGWRSDSDALETALALANKAVQLNKDLPLAHSLRGWIYLWLKDYEQALADSERAVRLDPNYAEGFARFGHVLDLAGQPKDGIGLIERALRLDPHAFLYLFFLGHAHVSLGRDEEGVASFRRAAARNGDHIATRQNLTACLANMGYLDEAREQAAKLLELEPRFSIKRYQEMLPYRNLEVLKRQIIGLRAAGLPD